MFENFPYTDMHQLNLDWIIKIAKDFLDQYTSLQQMIADGETSLQSLTDTGLQQLQDKADTLETLLNEWYNTHSTDIANQLASALQDLNDWYTTHQNYLNTTLTENIALFNTRANQIAEEVEETLPQTYTDLSDDVFRLKKGFINSVNLLDPLTFRYGGYYNSAGNWVENTTVTTSNFIECEANDIFYTNYYPAGTGATFFNENKEFVSQHPTTIRDGKIVIPNDSNIKYFNFTFSTTSPIIPIMMICKDIRPDIYVSPYIKDLEFYSMQDKNIMIFGDSFSAVASRWLNQFIIRENPKSITNLAVSGAHWRDYYDTPYPYNGNPVGTSDQKSNVMGNQVQKALNGINNNEYPIPDIVIMFAGTNDNWSYEDNYTIESQFTDGGTSYVPLENVNRTLFAGAMRWCVQHVYSDINSNAEILIITPAQCADAIADYPLQKKKADRIKEVAQRMSLKVIDVFNESGIWDFYETRDLDGKWLIDGLHPNTKGGVKLGNFIADKYASMHITSYYSSVASWAET